MFHVEHFSDYLAIKTQNGPGLLIKLFHEEVVSESVPRAPFLFARPEP